MAGQVVSTSLLIAERGAPVDERDEAAQAPERAATAPLSGSPFVRIGTLPGYETWTGAASGCETSEREATPTGRETSGRAETILRWMPRGRFAMGLGDPAGPASERTRAARDFARAAERRGLEAVLAPVGSPRAYREAGYRLFPVGVTARLDLHLFSLSGRPRHSIRHGVNRARRAGLWAEIVPGRDVVAELARVSRAWLDARRLPERRFGTGWFHPELVAAGRVAVVRDGDGTVQAFATLIEGHRDGEAAVDLMRHRPDAPTGAMDLLLVETAMRLRDEGHRVLDLGLCPLAGCEGHGLVGRFLGWVYRHGKPWYDFRGLHAFKAKFGPRFERRYLAYRSRRSLLPALVALAELDRPRFGRRSEPEPEAAWTLAPTAG